MREIRKRIRVAIFLMLAGLLIFPGPSSAAPQGSMTVALSSDISSLDTQYHNIRVNYIVGWNLYDNLVYRDQKTLKIGPHLAESWKLIDDNTWEFKLRRGIKFGDGEPFTAESVKFTIERGQDPKCPQRPYVSWIKEVKIIDDYTLRLISANPYPVALERLANFQMLPAKWLKEKGTDYFTTHANGTGPYRLKEWKRGVHVILEVKDNYWKGAPAIKTIMFRPIKEISTQISELLTGGIDIVRDIPPDQISLVENSGIARVSKAPTLRQVYLVMDADGRAGRSPVQNLKVRQAISHAIDIDTLIKTVMNGNATRTAACLNPAHFGYDKSLENPYPYNPEKAKQLLKEASFPFDQPLRLVTYTGSIQNPRALIEAVAGFLNKVGIKTNVNVYTDIGTWDRLGREGKQNDLSLHSWGGGGVYDADAVYYNYFRKGEAFCYGSSPEMDRWLDQARSTMNPEVRKKLYFQAGKYINDHALAFSFWSQYTILGLNKRIIYEAPPDEFLRTFEAKLKE
ncbi:MAG TPA: ABC transporter substrate-binding protein [Thermodesulfobacteriota bacterium]|nr:ABC transporter substrate-binding protein [Thermodesulfobacteriota bacterium]